jgi:hypothetical protein
MQISTIFKDRLPHRPYCADDLSAGVRIRPAAKALEFRHVQPNPPSCIAWMVFDVDSEGAAFAWERANLPPPTLTVINPENAHAHLFYGLSTPIVTSELGRGAPMRYGAALQAAYLARLCADTGYAGLIAKNPFHDHWRTIWTPHLYDLGELAEYVDLSKKQLPKECFGMGRNCRLFDELRAWGYQWIREYKRNHATSSQWQNAVLGQASRMNEFDVPLPLSEVKATAKSIAKWTWRNFSDAHFSAIQSARGRLGGRPKTTSANGAPWEALGMGRATYYRRAKSGLLLPADVQ